MQTNLHVKTHSASVLTIVQASVYNVHVQISHSSRPSFLKAHLPWDTIKCLLKIHKSIVQFLHPCLVYLLYLSHDENISVDNNSVDCFQSAYRAGHRCETHLLRVYNDIVTTIGKGNGSFLVILDLSAAFDTIDHDNLFYMLERYVGIGASALRLIRSYFSDHTQRVQIDGILTDFASLLCGVPQGSVLGPMKFCLYLLPLGAILRHLILAITFMRMTPNSIFHLSVRILWNH